MGGSALLDAAAKLRAALRAAAARRLNCGAGEVVLADERARGPDGKSVPWAELAPEPISVEGAFVNHKHTWSYGAHAAHVTVDAKTGQVVLLDYVAVEDCGRMINPLTLKGQLVGAVVQGLGGAFLEHLVYDEQGQLLTGSLADYLLPTASDFPKIRGYVMESHPSPINPLGAKGAGEGGIISVGGVMANAVADALSSFGIEPRDLPLTPARVWQLVQEARK
jgi:carbon-monoxide dehydrogenase large subunit